MAGAEAVVIVAEGVGAVEVVVVEGGEELERAGACSWGKWKRNVCKCARLFEDLQGEPSK